MMNISIDTVKTGQNIKKYRERKGLTVLSVAETLGLDCPQSVYKWERGESMPRIDNFFAICYLYGVSPKDLLCFYDSDYARHIGEILNIN